MYKHIAISAFLLFLSTVVNCQQNGFVITYLHFGNDNCNTSATSAQAHAVGVCFDQSFLNSNSSVIYTVSSDFTSFNNTMYNTVDCTGEASVSTSNFSTCVYGVYQYEYSATVPALKGIVSASGSSCTAAPTSYTYSLLLDVCQKSGGSGSSLISYAGGDSCFYDQFASDDCTGDVTAGGPYPEVNCGLDFQGKYTTSGCQPNGQFLPASTLKPTFGDVFSQTQYPTTSDCSGPVGDVDYAALEKCDGKGTSVTVDSSQHVIFASFDNYNCTGNLIYSAIAGNISQCEADESTPGGSYKVVKSAFPTNYNNIYAVITTDSCTNPTVTYSVQATAVGCVPQNKTSAVITGCSKSGSNLLLTETTYANLQCSGTGVVTENLTAPACVPGTDGQFLTISCPSSSTGSPTTAPTSAPSTSSPTQSPSTTSPTSSPTTGTAAPTRAPTQGPTSTPTATPTPRATTTGNSTTSGKVTTTGTTTNKPTTTTSSASFRSSSVVVCVVAVLAAMIM